LEQNNQNTGGAYIEKAENAYFIRSVDNREELPEGVIIEPYLDGRKILQQDLFCLYGSCTTPALAPCVGAMCKAW
jgi:Cu/Ag efflux pump CusA